MASSRADFLIKLIGSEIPVKAGSNTYDGFVALKECDGRTYQDFRNQAVGSMENPNRRFSPSSVIKLAEKKDFARLVPIDSEELPKRPMKSTASKSPISSKFVNNSLRYTDSHGLLGAAAKVEIGEGVNINRPGIYSWEIQDVGVYVGRYTNPNRPLGEYDKNVSRLLRGEAYRPKKPDGFRAIHRALAQAVKSSRRVTLKIVENCPESQLAERERFWISILGKGNLNR